MRSPLILTLSLALALPAASQTVLSEVSGNWAGASNRGFFFLARLSQSGDTARLVIWGGATDKVPTGEGAPEFDNSEIALGAFATRQALEVFDTDDGSILQVVTEFADEDAKGRSVVQIQYIDFQYTVVGFFHQDVTNEQGGEPSVHECEVDFEDGIAVENGRKRQLAPMALDELNASDWTFRSAFDRGFCSRG